MFCYQFGFGQQVGNESQGSATLADKVKTRTSFGRGRRERRCAGEEKEEGYWDILIAFSKADC